MDQELTREELEQLPNIQPKLNGYTYLDLTNVKTNKLKIDYFVLCIKKPVKQKPAIAITGKIEEIITDESRPTKIKIIKFKSNPGKTYTINTQANESMIFYYKKYSVEEERKTQAIEWKKKLTAYERQKMRIMQQNKASEQSNSKKKQITKKFYDWLYERRPELNV